MIPTAFPTAGGKLCRCPPDECLLHPGLATCSVRGPRPWSWSEEYPYGFYADPETGEIVPYHEVLSTPNGPVVYREGLCFPVIFIFPVDYPPPVG